MGQGVDREVGPDRRRGAERSISKNYYLRPELPVHLTHGTRRTQTDVLDATLD